MDKVRILQVKSQIKKEKNQKLTLEALGLGRIGKSNELFLTPQVKGMINKVKHLVKVENI